jgi:hypothetical protein
MKNLKPWVDLIDAVVSLAIKVRDARRPRALTCEHKFFVAHHRAEGVEHKDDIFCACKPTYQCLICLSVWHLESGVYRQVTR